MTKTASQHSENRGMCRDKAYTQTGTYQDCNKPLSKHLEIGGPTGLGLKVRGLSFWKISGSARNEPDFGKKNDLTGRSN